MQLWLQGPQSLEALGELAARFAAGLAAGEAPPPAPPLRLGEFTALQLAVSSQPALWRCPLIALSDNVTLLREFLLDEAPGSLMAGLRQRRLAGDVALNWLYQDRHLGWLALVFASDRPEEVDRQITHWLQALQQTTPEQQQHYYQLSRRRFQALSPLDQLRQRAFGFAPGAPPAGFADFCAALQAAPVGQPGLSDRFPGEPVATQGFSLPLSRWRRRPESDPALAFAFYPQAASDLVAKCPEKAAPLLHLPSPGDPPRPCCDRPSTARPIRPRGWRVGNSCAHCLPPCAMPGTRRVASVRRQLAVGPPAAGARPTAGGDPAGHPAAARAPGRLADPTAGKYRYPSTHGSTPRTAGYIRASGRLAGGPGRRQREDAQWVARQLSLITAPVNPPMPAPAPCRRGVERLVYPGGDTALLVFIPLPDGASLAALRLLAQHCEPLFFQRLRVEQQIGYVVSCRYQRVADRDGLLMVLQSPDRRAGNCCAVVKTFCASWPPWMRRPSDRYSSAWPLRSAPADRQRRGRCPPCVRSMVYQS